MKIRNAINYVAARMSPTGGDSTLRAFGRMRLAMTELGIEPRRAASGELHITATDLSAILDHLELTR